MTQWVDVACRHKLQRGRAFEGAEILIAQCRPVVVFGGFNGAALLRARRFGFSSVLGSDFIWLQRGRAFEGAEMGQGADSQKSGNGASTGPRF